MCLFTLVCSLCTLMHLTLVPVQMARFLTQLHLLDWWKCCNTDSVAEVKHLQQDKGQATLKKSHKYYWQFQGQLVISGLEWCDFVTDTHRFDSAESLEGWGNHPCNEAAAWLGSITTSMWMFFSSPNIEHCMCYMPLGKRLVFGPLLDYAGSLELLLLFR